MGRSANLHRQAFLNERGKEPNSSRQTDPAEIWRQWLSFSRAWPGCLRDWIGNRVCREIGITNSLEAGDTPEGAANLANHADVRSTCTTQGLSICMIIRTWQSVSASSSQLVCAINSELEQGCPFSFKSQICGLLRQRYQLLPA